MNESLILLQVIIVMAFGFAALRMGKATLITWIAFQTVLANFFALKQIHCFGLHVVYSDVFTIGSILGLNLLREYFDKEAASKALWTSFFTMFFFVVMTEFHLLYDPSSYDTTHFAYDIILSPSPRLLIASLSVFLIVQQIDLRLFHALKQRKSSLPLAVRNGVCVVSTQLLDTILFSFLGLWGYVSSLFDVMLFSFQIKLLLIILMTPLIHFSKRFAPVKAYTGDT